MIIHTQSTLISPTLSNAPKHISISPLVVVAIIVIAILLPLPVSTMPITPLQPTPSFELSSSNLSPTSQKVIFDIVFGLGLSFLAIGAYACVASGDSFTWFNSVIDRTCTAFDTLRRYLSPFSPTSLFARTGDAVTRVNDSNNSSTRNGGGEVRSVPATV